MGIKDDDINPIQDTTNHHIQYEEKSNNANTILTAFNYARKRHYMRKDGYFHDLMNTKKDQPDGWSF
ncbi:hypothetical protein [Peribacillus frigoritolerans]|uniref:hypothetical protein n=1 Tax=Peribacillus frigoritolerans TaxID=450367 RepID=UPI002079EA52|nr:hypothetical protein [Peribacillus frigoritolerans]USK75422.1 hypothetical protein LIT31_02150 [Peribacillus frigoritolerans]